MTQLNALTWGRRGEGGGGGALRYRWKWPRSHLLNIRVDLRSRGSEIKREILQIAKEYNNGGLFPSFFFFFLLTSETRRHKQIRSFFLEALPVMRQNRHRVRRSMLKKRSGSISCIPIKVAKRALFYPVALERHVVRREREPRKS